MEVGTVLRSHAGGSLVHSDALGVTLQCAARGRLKKERISILTGDRVKLDEVDLTTGSAVIAGRLERENLLTRPPIANVDQVIIVQSVHQPEWNPLLCDRYLVHYQLELGSGLPILCVNKCDLADSEDLVALQKIYEPLGYSLIIVSAVTGQGMESFIQSLTGKVSVLAGPSGVGKSSLINYLDPALHLKVGLVDEDVQLGRHTTTYSELYRIRTGMIEGSKPSWVGDTPGFNLAELKHPEPYDVIFQFPELSELYEECKFSNCTHLVEQGCNVLANLDKIAPSRYQSYVTLVTEAQAEGKLRKETSQKVEASVKVVGGKKGKGVLVPRLSGRYRASSRRTEKQQLSDLHHEDDDELDEESTDDN
jgi:ribosome biogenesis GTPase